MRVAPSYRLPTAHEPARRPPVPVLSPWVRRPAPDASGRAVERLPAANLTGPAGPVLEPASAIAEDAAVGAVIDAAGALVQLVGTCAHDTDLTSAGATRERATRWRRHLVTGLDHPDTEPGHPGWHPRGGGLEARDWVGAARWATATRQAEHAYVSTTIDTLRDTVWTLVQGLDNVVGADATAGRHERAALRRVREAITQADLSELRGVALAAIGDMAALLADRDRERERQLDTLGRRVLQLDGALEEARREGATDVLTGLGNRRAFDAAVEHAVALHHLLGQRFCLVSIDADGLKAINDTYGHPAGDDALRAVARQMARVFLRRSDVAVRNGGDEFAVLMRDISLEDAARLAQRLVEYVAQAPASPGEAEHAPAAAGRGERGAEAGAPPAELRGALGISAGVALLTPDESAADWIARADAALYAAKRGGKGRVEIAP